MAGLRSFGVFVNVVGVVDAVGASSSTSFFLFFKYFLALLSKIGGVRELAEAAEEVEVLRTDALPAFPLPFLGEVFSVVFSSDALVAKRVDDRRFIVKGR